VRVVRYFWLLGSALWFVGCLVRVHVSFWEGSWVVLCVEGPGAVVFVSGSVLGRWVDSWVPEVWSLSLFPGWPRSISEGLHGCSMPLLV
jgi:hypothetical protein